MIELVTIWQDTAHAIAGAIGVVPAAISWASAFAATALLGVVKKTDSGITNNQVYRKAQPFLALGLTLAAPWIARGLGQAVDPQAFVQAPLATIVAIGTAELVSLLQKQKTPAT